MPAKKKQYALSLPTTLTHAHTLQRLIQKEIIVIASYMGELLSGESSSVENQELFSSFRLVKGLE